MILSLCLQKHFESQHMDIIISPYIYEWEQPNKNSEDNYEDRGFWGANYLNFPQQNISLAYS